MFRDTPTPIEEDLYEMITYNSRRFGIVLPENFNSYACPITKLLIFDPMTNQSCGHCYENTQITLWQQEQKKNNRNEEKKEEDVVCTCPCPSCQKPLTTLEPNAALKNEIAKFLMDIRSQLTLDVVRANPNDPYNADRQEITRLCTCFLKYGNHDSILKEKFKKFFKCLMRADFKKSAEASKESSVIASSSCRLL